LRLEVVDALRAVGIICKSYVFHPRQESSLP